MYECYIDLYDQYFYLFFGKGNWRKFAKAIELEECDSDINSRGLVLGHHDKKFPKCIYIWFPDRSFQRVKEGTLAHEIVHLVDHIAMNKGIKHDVDNQEVYAQFVGYLFRSLLPFFKKK